MKLNLDIDEQVLARASKMAEARDMTVEAMVVEYLTGIATSEASARLERIDKVREAIKNAEDEAGIISLNRDDLYDRPYRYYYGK